MRFGFLTGLTVFTILGASSTQAGVLDDFFELIEAGGGSVEYRERVEVGGTVEFIDLEFTGAEPESPTISFRYMRETVRGGVSEITPAPEALITFPDVDVEGPHLLAEFDGLTVTAKPQEAETTLGLDASAVAISIVEGVAIPDLNALSLVVSDLSGAQTLPSDMAFDDGDPIDIAGEVAVGKVELLLDTIGDEGEEVRLDLGDGAFGFRFDMAGEIPPDDAESPVGFLTGSYDMEIALTGGMSVTDAENVIVFDVEDFAGVFSGALTDEIFGLDLAFDLGRLAADMDITEEDGRLDLIYESVDYSVSGRVQGPPRDPETYETLDGVTALLAAEAGGTSMEGSIEFDKTPIQIAATGGLATAEIGLEDGRGVYDVASADIRYTLAAPSLGIQSTDFAVDDVKIAFAMPMVMRDEPEPVLMILKLTNLLVGDGLWNLFDPTELIPRDAANLDIDISGAMRWLEEPVTAGEADVPPIALETFSINALNISAGGAEITADGAADIDTSGPVPRGDGQLTVSIGGVIGLSGALAELGLVPPDAVLGLRGMLGAFAKPVGEDAYESLIEFKPDGTVTANGLPLPIQ